MFVDFEDWNDSGFLEDIDEQYKEGLINCFNKTVDYLKKNENLPIYLNFEKAHSEIIIFPLITKIYTLLMFRKEILNLINIENIMNELTEFRLKNMIKIEKKLIKQFKNLDIEAKLMSLFCQNYVQGLFKQYNKLKYN